MAGSPVWKVYDPEGTYQASCKEPELAGLAMSFYGDGSTIRHGHTLVVWTEGQEECPGSESYDTVATTCYQRVDDWHRAENAKRKAYAARMESSR